MTTYTVTVTREDNLWTAVVDGLPRGVVGAMDYENFGDVADEVPELIADLTDADPAAFTIDWRYVVNGKDVTEVLVSFLDHTQTLRQAQAEQDRARKEALAAMADAGLSQRAMADVVGVSHQRVNQLVNS